MYKSDDFRPYLYKTSDYGKTWTKIVNGIPENAFTRVIREDPHRKGLLVAGTEFGLYLSMDDGANWKPFQQNLPVTPITDIAFHKREQDLVIATQCRSFYVMDDLPLLYQLTDGIRNEAAHLFRPKDAYRFGSGGRGGGRGAAPGIGENPPAGAVISYWLKDRPQGELTLEFLDNTGKLVRKYSSREVEQPPPALEEEEEGGFRPPPAPALDRRARHEPLRLEPPLAGRDRLSRHNPVGCQPHRPASLARTVHRQADGRRQIANPAV
jgi:hypothetical protein